MFSLIVDNNLCTMLLFSSSPLSMSCFIEKDVKNDESIVDDAIDGSDDGDDDSIVDEIRETKL